MVRARDVCESIDRAWAGSTLASLDASEKGRRKMTTPNGGAQSFTIISESGLYKLILRAHPHVNPAAKAFQNWVTKEVLPAIRKDGAYVMGEEKVKACRACSSLVNN